MEQDKFALVEKILKDIEIIMSRNSELCSFEVVPVDSNTQNKSPVLYFDNCMGLESWCVKHVYMYCYTEIMDKYLAKTKRKSWKITSINSERLFKLVNIVLLLNPELSILWNMRRDMVQKKLFDICFELKFTKLILSRKAKCNDAFSYRRWLLDIVLNDNILSSNNIDDLINDELQICKLASDKYPNNYHSWNHRIWLLKKLQTITKPFNLTLLFIREYEFSELWTSKHISDFSCFHYRQFCIQNIFKICTDHYKTFINTINADLRKSFVRLLATNFPKDVTVQASEADLISYSEEELVSLLMGEPKRLCNCLYNNSLICQKLEILFYELCLNNELIKFYKHHETLWYHRRFIVHEILEAMYDYFGLVKNTKILVKKFCKVCYPEEMRHKQTKMLKYDTNCIYSSILFNILRSHEQSFIKERSLDSDHYAERHEKYLKFVKGFSDV